MLWDHEQLDRLHVGKLERGLIDSARLCQALSLYLVRLITERFQQHPRAGSPGTEPLAAAVLGPEV
jgi:hypothetical protein